MITRREHLEKRLAQLTLSKSEWEGHWRELSRYISPRTSRFLTTDRQAQGNKRFNDINDSAATQALRSLVAGFVSGVTSPARPWISLRPLDREMAERRDVRAYLEQVRDIALEILLQSNAYTILPMIYNDLGCYGTAALVPEDDPETVVRYRALPLGSYCLGANETGRVDTCYREFQMTVAQIVGKFGLDNCPTNVKSSWESGNTDVWIDVVHAIEPNAEWDRQKAESKYKRFLSAYWCKGSREEDAAFLSLKGFDRFPVIAPRWEILGEDVYGSSPGMVALGDVKMLQLMQRRKLQVLDKIATPPMVGDVSLKNKRASVLSGDITYVQGGAQQAEFRPAYQITGFGFADFMNELHEVRGRIDEAFYKNLFLMISQLEHTGITATEIAARKEEKLMALGPVYMRLNDELLDPLVEDVIDRAGRKGLLPPPPPEMAGQPVAIEYISVMAQTMRSIGVENIERLMAFAGSLATVYPQSLNRLNADKALTRYADMVGVPSDVVFDDDQVAAAAAAEAQAQKAQQALAMAEQGSVAVKNLAQSPTTDNALSGLMQAMQGAPSPAVPAPGGY